MPTAILEKPSTDFAIADEAIAEMAERYLPLIVKGIDDAKGFDEVHKARMVVRGKRVDVENTRKRLKADALEYGRMVDSEAKRIFALIEPIERHLQEQEDKVTKEKQRLKDEAEAKRQAMIRDRLQKLALCGCTYLASDVEGLEQEKFDAFLADKQREQLERQEAEARAEAERKAEAERLAKERAELDAQRKVQEAEAARIAAEQKKLADAEAARLREIELENARKEAAEKAKREEAERIQREAEAKFAKAQAEAAEAKRLKELRPDYEKLLSVADAVSNIDVPVVGDGARDIATRITELLESAEQSIRHLIKPLTK